MTFRRLFISLVLLAVSASSYALEKKKFCMYDPVGKGGPAITFFTPLKAEAIKWGYEIELEAYTDEKVASNNFKAGQCDATFLTAILSRPYVPFGGTLDAIGGILDEKGLGIVLKAVATNKAMTPLLSNGNYEVVGSLPVGSVYLFMKDRNVDSVAEFSGKKISVLNEDPQSHTFAKLAGATPKGTTLATFSGEFNNGNIDILPMVALGYDVFELYKGLGTQGGIIDYPILYGMMQMVAHKDRFNAEFGNNMRNYILGHISDINKMVTDATASIKPQHWIKTNDAQKAEIDEFIERVRNQLESDKVHHPKGLAFLKKVRCATHPTRAECAR